MGSAVAGSSVDVNGVWSRATAPGAANGAVFLTIKAAADDRLLAAESAVADRAELHDHQMDGGVARMRKVSAVKLPAGQDVTLQPGGMHVMLMGLKAPLVAGERFPLRLELERAGAVEVTVAVGAPGATLPTPSTHGHGSAKKH
jgi:copper(I)-binding protein